MYRCLPANFEHSAEVEDRDVAATSRFAGHPTQGALYLYFTRHERYTTVTHFTVLTSDGTQDCKIANTLKFKTLFSIDFY